MKNLRTKIGGAILTLAFIFGISVAAGMTAQAQYPGDRDAQRRDRRRDNDDRWNGNQSQNRDWRRDRDRDWRRDQDRDRDRDDRWRRNDRNNGRYGSNGSYGNNGGYGNYGGYGNNGGYGNGGYGNGGYGNGGYGNGGYGNGGYGNYGGYQAAANQGYQYGLSIGASDAQRGQNFNPQRSHYYRNASSQAFRSGFVQGYQQGYRPYSGYGNRGYGRGSILGGIFGRP